MVFRRKVTRRRAPVRKRQFVRRRKIMRPARPARPLKSTNFITVIRDSPTLSKSWTVLNSDTDRWFSDAQSFRLQDFNGYAEFQNICDQYKINWVKVNFYFQGNSQPQVDAYFGTMPMRFATAIDYDDVTPYASSQIGWDALHERKGCLTKVVTASRGGTVSRKFVPRLQSPVLISGSTYAYVPTEPKFIDCTTINVPHLGLKYCLELPKIVGTGSYTLRYDYTVTYCVSFKNMH